MMVGNAEIAVKLTMRHTKNVRIVDANGVKTVDTILIRPFQAKRLTRNQPRFYY